MALCDGSFVFVTDGSAPSLAALPGAAGFADDLGFVDDPVKRFTVVRLLTSARFGKPQPDRDERIKSAVAALGRTKPPNTLAVKRADLRAFTNYIGGANGGILAITTAPLRGLRRFAGGKNYERLLSNGSFAVLVLPPQPFRLVRRVLFPVDLAPRSAAVFDETIELCRALTAELHLLHVFGADRLLPNERDVARRAATRSPLELLRMDQGQINDLAARAKERNVVTHVQMAEGRAHAQILAYAAAQNIDLVVMASHGPRSIEDTLLGSTTIRVLRRAALPVLAVRTKKQPTQPAS